MAEIDFKKKAYDHFLKQAKDDETKKARLKEAYNLSLHEFTKVGHGELGFGCPPELPFACADGSCAKNKEDCGRNNGGSSVESG